jgi:FtsZ-binding cell division protein ZapB
MNIVKKIETIIKVREELYELQKKAEHLQRELDSAASEIVGFLREAGHLKKNA